MSPGQRADRGAPDVTVEFDVPARMRDGVQLSADIYRPARGGPWPTLLTRLPYGKRTLEEMIWSGIDPVETARRGFVVIVQDVRGRFASGGEWQPMQTDAADGYDTVEWAATLPGANGRVAMYGGSYHGNTQWMAAVSRPPALTAIAPQMTWSDPMDGLFQRGGALELGFYLHWNHWMAAGHVERMAHGPEAREAQLAAILDDWERLGERGFWTLPVKDAGVLSRHGVPESAAAVAGEQPDAVAACRVAGAYEQIAVPAFNSGGWYDLFTQGTIDNYVALRHSQPDARLVMGPWSHEEMGERIGEMSVGFAGMRDGTGVHPHGSWVEFQLAWLRHQLDPSYEAKLPSQPVRIFTMGRNQWRDEPTWPIARARSQRWYLHPGGGLSSIEPQAHASSSGFIYDPASPVPTVGGNVLLPPRWGQGPLDQRELEARDDVLVFTSQVLADELEVTGRIRVVLYAASSAPSTDWVARLCDVHPDGRSINICDGILRVAHGADRPVRHEIDLWSTSIAFLPGHRLRVHVTSSSFPRWDRNLNTGDQSVPATVPARQQVFHDWSRSSHIDLPVVPE